MSDEEESIEAEKIRHRAISFVQDLGLEKKNVGDIAVNEGVSIYSPSEEIATYYCAVDGLLTGEYVATHPECAEVEELYCFGFQCYTDCLRSACQWVNKKFGSEAANEMFKHLETNVGEKPTWTEFGEAPDVRLESKMENM